MTLLHEILWKYEQEWYIFQEQIRTIPSTTWVGYIMMLIGMIIFILSTPNALMDMSYNDINITNLIPFIGLIIIFAGSILL